MTLSNASAPNPQTTSVEDTLETLPPIQQEFRVSYRYSVQFTQNLFEIDNRLLADVIGAQGKARTLFVVDAGLHDHRPILGEIIYYARQYSDKMKLVTPPLVVPAGENAKNDSALVGQICTLIAAAGICRHSYVVAVGGGAVLDLVGYAAAIAHRGLRLIRVPTTVLAQSDSGVGVKNGINAFGKKNFLGTFTPPYAVINDLSFLTSLSARDWRSGMVEAVKVALIKDSDFFEQIEQDAQALSQRDERAIQRLIYRCAQLHVEHIGTYGDPFEQGSSRPLDFGHWAAHWLEQLTNYRLRHGEAVAIGVALDTLYSQVSGLISKVEADRVLALLTQLGFALHVPEMFNYLDEPEHPQSLFAGLSEFQAHLGGELTIMLLWAIGQGVEVHEVDFSRYREAIALLATYACRQHSVAAQHAIEAELSAQQIAPAPPIEQLESSSADPSADAEGSVSELDLYREAIQGFAVSEENS